MNYAHKMTEPPIYLCAQFMTEFSAYNRVIKILLFAISLKRCHKSCNIRECWMQDDKMFYSKPQAFFKIR